MSMPRAGYGIALQAASYEGHAAVVTLFLEKGANINALVSSMIELVEESTMDVGRSLIYSETAVKPAPRDQLTALGGYCWILLCNKSHD
jgi:ankyrin repeat protein